MITIEVCLEVIESAIAAQLGGANRVELCDNLTVGGTTPSIGLIKQVRQQIEIDLQVIVRPRGGVFCYTNLEFEVMKSDVEAVKSAGANGIVIGILNPDATIDIQRTQVLVRLAEPLPVTFHRAFDYTPDPFLSLEILADNGISRILSSGQATSALKGVRLLKQLKRNARDRVSIMAGGSVNSQNAPIIVKEAKVTEVHAGSSCVRLSKGNMNTHLTDITIDHRNPINTYPQVSAKLVQQLVQSVHKIVL